MKHPYLLKMLTAGLFVSAFPMHGDAQIKVLFEVTAPQSMSWSEMTSQQTLYISDDASLLNDSAYVVNSSYWDSEPVVKNGRLLKVSLASMSSDSGNGWGITSNVNAVDVQRQLGLADGATLYYRLYNPHFIKPIKGSAVVAPDEAGYQRVRISQMAEAQRVTFQPALDREGNALPVYVAPDLSSSSHTDWYADRNLVEINPKNNVNADGYNFYVPSGEKVRYAVMPVDANSTLLAMHVDSVTVGNADLNIETDYRKAVLCRLYVNDAKGNRLNITRSQALGTAYYNLTPNAPCYGWGCFNKNYFGRGEELNGGTLYVYALPGKQIFQLKDASVENPDADFIFPYNAQANWLLSDVTIREGVTEQDVVMAQYSPMTVTTTLKNAAKCTDVEHLYIGHVARIQFPYASANDVTYSVTPIHTQAKRTGDDIVLTQTFHRADNMEMLSATLGVSREGDTIADALTSTFIYPEDLTGNSLKLSQSNYESSTGTLDFDKIHKVRVVVPCPYFKESKGEVVWYLDQTVQLAAGSHADGCSKALLSEAPYVPNDTLTFLLPEGALSYKVMNEDGEAVRLGSFVLSNSDETILSPFATNYSLLRVSDADGEHLINVTDGSEEYRYETSPIVQLEPTGTEGASEQHVYFSNAVTIPIKPGFNEYARSYREVKLVCAKNLIMWPATRCLGEEAEGLYAGLSIPDDAVHTSSAEHRIHLLQGQGMLLAACISSQGQYGVQLFDILPSDNDTLLAYPYDESPRSVKFYYNGESISTKCVGLLSFNLFREPDHVRVGFLDDSYAKRYNPWTANRTRLYPGKYQVSGILLFGTRYVEEEVPIGPVTFEVTDEAISVELNPEYTGIGAVETNDSAATIVARYTIDGRRINHPQPGINLLQMSDGTVRKVVVK